MQVMAEIGIDTSAQRSKPLKQYLGRLAVTHAIIVCESAARECPSLYPFALHVHHWPFDDQVAAPGGEAERLEAFRGVRDALRARLEDFLANLEVTTAER